MSNRSTIVLVPGNFAFQTRLVSLPSTGSKTPLTSNEPDVLAVRQVLEELSDSGKEIIVVAHSYGSIPTCEAVKGLGHEDRRKLGKSGGVVRLVMVAAWLLQEGENPPDIIGRYRMEAPWARFEGGNVFADDPTYAFHNDTSAEVSAYWSSYTTHSDLAAFATPLKYVAWRHIPTTHLVCQLDRAILPHVQESMIALSEGKVRAVRLSSGHMPMISMPEKLADILRVEAGGRSIEDH